MADEFKPKIEEVTRDEVIELARKISKNLADNGLLIEGGWRSFVIVCLQDASMDQLVAMRKAFYAGAQHLWGSIINTMDSDRDPTVADVRRMELINKELEAFVAAMEAEAKADRERRGH